MAWHKSATMPREGRSAVVTRCPFFGFAGSPTLAADEDLTPYCGRGTLYNTVTGRCERSLGLKTRCEEMDTEEACAAHGCRFSMDEVVPCHVVTRMDADPFGMERRRGSWWPWSSATRAPPASGGAPGKTGAVGDKRLYTRCGSVLGFVGATPLDPSRLCGEGTSFRASSEREPWASNQCEADDEGDGEGGDGESYRPV